MRTAGDGGSCPGTRGGAKKGKRGTRRRRIRRGPGAARSEGFLAACSENARVSSEMIVERLYGGGEGRNTEKEKERERETYRETSVCFRVSFFVI